MLTSYAREADLSGRFPTTMATVLVADDDPAIRMLVTMKLVDEGYEVATAANGAEASRQVEASLPDAIVLDLNMPVMDGSTLVQQCLRTMSAPPPVLLVSAFEAEGAAEELQLTDWLQKPFGLDALVNRVQELVALGKRQRLTVS